MTGTEHVVPCNLLQTAKCGCWLWGAESSLQV